MNKDKGSGRYAVLALLLGVSVSVGLVWAEPAWSQKTGGKEKDKDEIAEKVEMAGAAKVTIDQAIKAALEQVPGTVIEAELEEKPRVTWEVEVVTTEGRVMEILVDSDTGAVVATEEKKEEEESTDAEKAAQEKRREPGAMGRRHGMMRDGCCMRQ